MTKRGNIASTIGTGSRHRRAPSVPHELTVGKLGAGVQTLPLGGAERSPRGPEAW
jgi:hypothetical protein